MSKLDELLQGVKVEWLPLKEIAELQRGKTITAKNKTEGNIPVISGGQKPAYYNGEFNRTDETITIAGSGAYAGYISYWNEPIFVSDAFSIKPDLSILNIKYAYYFLLTKQEWIYSLKKGAGIPHVYPKDLEKLQIPIPCPDNPEKSLEIQQEIVRVLDELTTLTNQLTTELETERQNRKKQFEFFREQLFRFEEGNIEFKTLGDITKLITKGTTPKIFSSNGINFIKIESFNKNKIIPNKFMFISKEIHEKELKRSILKSEDILFAIAGATIGKCAIVSEDILPANTNQALAIIRLNENINVKYIFNFLQSLEMKKYIEKFNKTSAQPNLNLKQISDFKIPIPSLEEQERIVKLLDQFDATHTAIEEEITKEIKLRTQQYEYYREKLLSFPSLRTT
ncbi:restriction endonuclease subunit S [Empedobacter sp. UBA7494]|uniref:restriction endonuclease subunit S n=1 Tax=Empedobacter sp. UBA7494 TaxID=1946450 RepID=UPI0025B915AF|nr:restriction endonuclease subunit S [Empedobacter sp. UBA7494]